VTWACEAIQPHQQVQEGCEARAERRGKDMAKLKAMLERLIDGEPLPQECRGSPAAGRLCRQP
jgi:hypothetical protein